MIFTKTYNYKLNLIIILSIIAVLIYKHFFIFLPTGPTIIKDELLYKENAELLFKGKYFYHSIYPPLYSLVISIAFYFNNWYESIQIINSLTSTLLIIPIWMISRMFISPTKSLIVVLLLVLLPYHAFYPGYVMSENLFLLIFAFSIYFSIQGADTTYSNSILFGIFLGLGYLTKYLMLPAIPILIFFWILFPISSYQTRYKIFKSKQFWINSILLMSFFIFTLLPWIIFAQKSNLKFSDSLGFFFTGNKTLANISSGLLSNEKKLSNLLMWGSSYASYIILALAPFITPLIYYIFSFLSFKNKKKDYKIELFTILSISLLLMYWLVSTQHSFRASYNYPNPSYLLGRYLMHLSPFFIIIGIIAMEKIFKNPLKIKKLNMFFAIIFLITIMLLSRGILYKNGIWFFKPTFADNVFNSPDSLFYHIDFSFYSSIFFITLLGLLIILQTKVEIKKSKLFLIIFATILVSWQSLILKNASERIKNNISGIHARKLAEFLKSNTKAYNNTTIYYSVRYLWPEYWESVSLFWGGPKLNYVPLNEKESICVKNNSDLLLTENNLSIKPILSYKFLDGNCYLYKIKSGEKGKNSTLK